MLDTQFPCNRSNVLGGKSNKTETLDIMATHSDKGNVKDFLEAVHLVGKHAFASCATGTIVLLEQRQSK